MKLNRERRILVDNLEVRTEEGEEQEKIVGYAAKFNQQAQITSWFSEEIRTGAFDDVLDDDVRCMLNHDMNLILGRTKAGTLAISVDDFGLRYKNIPPETSYAKDLIISMKRGDVNQSSFGFIVATDGDEWEWNEETGMYHRTIHKYKRLFDASPVTIPAYDSTESVVTRSLEEIKKRFGPNHLNKKIKEMQMRRNELRLLQLM